MFCVFGLPEGETLSLRVEPDVFAALTRRPGIIPAPYLARHSWIFLESREVLPEPTVKDLIESSHAIVAAKLPKRLQRELGL